MKQFMLFFVMIITALSIFSTSAFAAIKDTDRGSIKVNGVEDGVTVSAYKLMDVNFEFDTDQPVDPPYIWDLKLSDWIRNNYPQIIDDDNAVNEAFSKMTSSEIAIFYDKLSAAIKGGTIKDIKSYGTRYGSGDITDLEMANYLIIIENGMKVYRPSAVNLVPKWENDTWIMTSPAVVQIKASNPSLDKKINENVNDGHDADISDNGNIGDIVNYDLRADIPQYPENAIAKGYAISDVLSKGLTLKQDTVKAYGVDAAGKEKLLTLNDDYTKGVNRPNDLGETSFTLNFNYEKIKNFTKIHVDFDAVLNTNAVIGIEGNSNNAYLDYNNNPYTSSSWKTMDDRVTYFTYGLDITKTDKKSPANVLEGAQFKVFRDKACTNTVQFIKVKDGFYKKAEAGQSGSEIIISNKDVKIELTGLDDGIY